MTGSMVDVAERERVALHESCHAVVGLLAGVEVIQLTLDPPRTTFTPPPWTTNDYRRAVLRRLALDLAPCAAQRTFGVDPFLAGDVQSASALAPFLDPVNPDTCVRRLLGVIQGVVAEYKETIERVAQQLVLRGWLTGAELREIVAAKSRVVNRNMNEVGTTIVTEHLR
jgi:hypothetical protein